MTLQEKITKFIEKTPHGTIFGYTLLTRPIHAQLPDYPYGYTSRAFKVDGTTLIYSQIMWNFLPICKELVGIKEADFPWEEEELAWVQGREDLEFGSVKGMERIEKVLKNID